MRQKIDCFLTCEDTNVINDEINKLRNSRTIQNIYLLMAGDNINNDNDEAPEGCTIVEVDRPTSSATIKKIAVLATAKYSLILTKATKQHRAFCSRKNAESGKRR